MMLRLMQWVVSLIGGTIHVDVVDAENCYRFMCTNPVTGGSADVEDRERSR
jgi:hypothetical protein